MPVIHELDPILSGPCFEYGNTIYLYHQGLQKNGIEGIEPCPYTNSDRFFNDDDISLEEVVELIREKTRPLAVWNVAFQNKYPFDRNITVTTPNQIDIALNRLEQDILLGKMNAGDILDIERYRGTGYYLIYEDDAGKLRLKATEGEYGIILPSEAYKYVREFGVRAYATLTTHPDMRVYLSGCKIPIEIAQLNRKRIEKLNIPLDKSLLIWYPARYGKSSENTYNVKFAGEHILDGLLCEMTKNIYFDIENIYDNYQA